VEMRGSALKWNAAPITAAEQWPLLNFAVVPFGLVRFEFVSTTVWDVAIPSFGISEPLDVHCLPPQRRVLFVVAGLCAFTACDHYLNFRVPSRPTSGPDFFATHSRADPF
jgi:hypothetical protein